jgi:DNA-binding response OmpR family regulator
MVTVNRPSGDCRKGKSMNPGPTRLLLIEDEELVSLAYSRVLEREGYSVTCVADGMAGLEMAASGQFDLCLLNVLLPGLGGYSIAQQVQNGDVDLPLIFLTSSPRDEVETKTRSLGLKVAYMEKPSSRKELVCKIEEVLDGKGWM